MWKANDKDFDHLDVMNSKIKLFTYSPILQ